MPRNVIPARFVPDNGTGYLMDIGIEIAANSRFVLPPDIDTAQAATILQNIGAEPLSENSNPIPCVGNLNADLRRLQFLRTSGGSMSVPVSAVTDLETAATVIRGILDGAGDEVVCIKLIGEFFPNLADELGLNYGQTTAPSHISVGNSKQFYYTGQVLYQSDTGGTVLQPIKSITDNENAPASQIASIWDNCVGDLSSVLPCRGQGRRNPRKHRRYTLTFAIGDNGVAENSEIIEVPVVSSDASDILNCGQAAAALPGAYCIEYRGESYNNFLNTLT